MTTLVIDKDQSVFHLELEKEASEELTRRFDDQATTFLSDAEEVPYVPGAMAGKDEVYVLEYDLPAELRAIKRSLPAKIPKYGKRELKASPPVALVSVILGTSPIFRFQSVDSQNILRPQSALLFGPGDYTFNKNTGLVPAKSVVAVHSGGNLLFRSEHIVRRFLDIEIYFTEATDNDIQEFFGAGVFVVEDMAAVKAVATGTMRRKLARLMREGDPIDAPRLESAASRSGMSIVFKGGAIVVPQDRKGLKGLIDLMSHAYVQSLYKPSQILYGNGLRPVVTSTGN